MSRIDDLIRELCPEGVLFRRVGDVCTVFSGFAFNSGEFNSSGDGLPLVRIRDVNTGLSGTYYSGSYEARFLVNDGDILIGMDGIFRPARWQHGTALLNQRVCRLQEFSPEILPAFMFHFVAIELERIQLATLSSTVKHLSSKTLAALRMPLPPLGVQREVVAVLDLFQKEQTALEAELAAELEARRQQYAFYRDQLLSFPEAGGCWIPMNEVGEFIRGRRFTKEDLSPEGIPAIHYGEIYTHYGTAARDALSHVREELADGLRYAKPGDVVVAGVGETVEDVAKAVAWVGDTDVAIHDDSFAFRSSQDPRFISYAMQTANFHAQKERYVTRAKVKRVSGEALGKIRIPAPPIDEQHRVVAILEELEALTTELTTALPAEIAARRQQYEYYRDRLLTFKEAA